MFIRVQQRLINIVLPKSADHASSIYFSVLERSKFQELSSDTDLVIIIINLMIRVSGEDEKASQSGTNGICCSSRQGCYHQVVVYVVAIPLIPIERSAHSGTQG